MGKGWISVHRSIFDCWIWQEKPFSKAQAWIDLLLLANHDSAKRLYNGELVTFEPGTVNRSIASLSDRWGWNRKTTTKFLKVLENDEMVTVKGTTHGTTITIVNYGKYQDVGSTKGTTKGQPDGQPRDSQMDTNNNVNNVNNENKRERAKFAPPSVQEVREYCQERKNNVDPEVFVDFYASKGWKVGKNPMKDWKACVRTWEKRRDEKSPPSKQKNKFHNFEEREIDFKSLEEKYARN